MTVRIQAGVRRWSRVPAVPVLAVCLLFGLSLAPLAGCRKGGGTAVEVTAAPGADFARYRTFSVEAGEVVLGERIEADRAAVESRLRDAVRAEMGRKGLKESPIPDDPAAKGAHLNVVYSGSAQYQQERERVRPTGDEGLGGPPPPAAGRQVVVTYTQIALTADLRDAATGSSVWKARGKVDVDKLPTPGELEKGVTRLLRDYPPKK